MNNDILPFFQGGGLVLPQYRPTGATLQTPQTANLLINTYNQNSQQDFGRYMQLEQLGMQRQQQAEQINNSRMDQQFKMSQQIRVNKQIDLQNKKFEYEQLQTIVTAQSKALEWGTDEFLPADQAKLDELFKPINEQLNTGDTLDLENIYKLERQKKMIAMHYENGYANKKEYTSAAKLLTNDPNQPLRLEYAKAGYIDQDADAIYVQNKIDYFKNLEQFKATGDRTYLDNVKALAPKIATIQDLIDEDAQNKINEANRMEQQATILQKQTTAELNIAKANNEKQTLPAQIEALNVKNKIANAEGKVDIRTSNIFLKWLDDNPNASLEEVGKAKQQILGTNKTTGTLSLDDQLAAQVANNDIDGQERTLSAMRDRAAAMAKTTNVNYGTIQNSAKEEGRVSKDGSIDFGGYQLDKAGNFVGGQYGGVKIQAKNLKKELDSKTIILQTDGSLKIKDDATIMKIFGIKATFAFGFGNTDAQDIKEALPGANKVDGSWIIPHDIIALPIQSEGSNSNSAINPTFKNNPIPNASSSL